MSLFAVPFGCVQALVHEPQQPFGLLLAVVLPVSWLGAIALFCRFDALHAKRIAGCSVHSVSVPDELKAPASFDQKFKREMTQGNFLIASGCFLGLVAVACVSVVSVVIAGVIQHYARRPW